MAGSTPLTKDDSVRISVRFRRHEYTKNIHILLHLKPAEETHVRRTHLPPAEMDIVRQLILDDGGEGTVEEVVPGEHGLGIFNTLLRDSSSFDATWVFMPWEVTRSTPTDGRYSATTPASAGRAPPAFLRGRAAAA